jgi:diguanylate cyclase (GGDEF)-like protein/PAS domain S-box-containing protein
MLNNIPQPKILVVDDRIENIRSMQRVLETIDAEVYTAQSGVEALGLLLRHTFSLILLDVMMPEMDGFETAELIRGNLNSLHTPIIFVTAADKEESFEFKGYDVGAVDYLYKPIQPHILQRKVRFFLELNKNKTLLEKSLHELERVRDHKELLLKSTAEGIISLDPKGHITFANPAAKQLLMYNDDTIEGLDYADIQGIDKTTFPFEQSALYHATLTKRSIHDDQQWFYRADGSSFPVEFTASPICNAKSESSGMVLVFQDISERKKTAEKLAYLAQYDSLTGLANRALFTNLLGQAISRSDRHHHNLALLFLDLDRFKQVNDSLGHDAGDLLLQQVAERLQSSTREGDTVSRLGGDEFTVILEEVCSESREAALVADKLIVSLNSPFIIKGHEVLIGTSIGIALYPGSAKTMESLLKCADMAMYLAKARGRNNFQFYTAELQQQASKAIELENRLRHALQRREFFLHYQPQVDTESGQIIGLEALLRWQPDGQALVPPSEFISVAEEAGLIVPIGEWVLRNACAQLQRWHASGLLSPAVSISVNLSVRQLENKSLLTTLTQILQETGLKPSQLELEITESAVMKDPDVVVEVLRRIHEQGIQLSLDDFGTGYSSLSYLKLLPLDILKIDRSFINDIGGEQSDEAILESIISLSRNLNLRVVAEGVETQEQLHFLQRLNCHSIQGYYISEPKSPADIEEMLHNIKDGNLLPMKTPVTPAGLILVPRVD